MISSQTQQSTQALPDMAQAAEERILAPDRLGILAARFALAVRRGESVLIRGDDALALIAMARREQKAAARLQTLESVIREIREVAMCPIPETMNVQDAVQRDLVEVIRLTEGMTT